MMNVYRTRLTCGVNGSLYCTLFEHLVGLLHIYLCRCARPNVVAFCRCIPQRTLCRRRLCHKDKRKRRQYKVWRNELVHGWEGVNSKPFFCSAPSSCLTHTQTDMSTPLYKHTHTHTHAHTHTHTYIYIYTYLSSIRNHTHKHAYTSIYVPTPTHIYHDMDTYMHTHIHIHNTYSQRMLTHASMDMFKPPYIYIYIYICVCVFAPMVNSQLHIYVHTCI